MNTDRTALKQPYASLPTFLLLAALSAACAAREEDAGQASRPNVLFIAIDDLRPQLGCYGYDYMKTPHLDRLARQGRRFDRHYVQVPTCGASRFALLTGRRPSQTKALNNGAFGGLSREELPAPQTMPEHFRRHGYTTVCIGKISHQPDGRVFAYDGSGDGRDELPHAWSRLATPLGKWKYGWGAFFAYADGSHRSVRKTSPPLEAADVADEGYPDGLIAQAAIEQLGKLRDEPFLLAVGFYKPHLPFTAPKKYWDLYDPAAIPLSPNPVKPQDIHPQSWHNSGEMFGRYEHPRGRDVDKAHARHLRHGYFACVSYVDAQVGKLLAELERLQLAEKTIVVVWGDHGWHLGDHAVWGKHTCFERALRSALILRTPGMPQPGKGTRGIAESLDLYPTLADLCRLPQPAGLAGESLRPLLADPAHAGKDGALGYWKNGRTLRTDRWRITRYPTAPRGGPTVELYDHQNDPHEAVNVAAQHEEVVAALIKQLNADTPEMPTRK